MLAQTHPHPAVAVLMDKTAWDAMSPDARRAAIVDVEAALLANVPEGADQMAGLAPQHYFGDGCYARALVIPAGVLVVGGLHKEGHVSVLASGIVTIWTEYGVETLEAPFISEAAPGIKRVAFAHADCTWVSLHGNADDARDPDALFARLIAPDYAALEAVRPVQEIAA